MLKSLTYCILIALIHLVTGWCRGGDIISENCVFDKNDSQLINNVVTISNDGYVNFLLKDNDKHEIKIYYIKGVYKKYTCNKNNGSSKAHFASFTIKNTKSFNNCSQKNQTVCVPYIFQGCYSFMITPYIGTNSLISTNNYLWVENNFTLKNFAIEKPTFPNPECVNQLSGMEPYMRVLWIIPKQNFINGNITYQMELKPNYTLSYDSVDITKNCSVTGFHIVCSLHHLSSDIYDIFFYLYDDWRCKIQDGVFNERCNWRASFEVNRCNLSVESLILSNPINKNYWLQYSLIPVLSLIFIATYFIFWIIKNKRDKEDLHIVNDHLLKENTINPKLEIFLVYARDCEPFMNTMTEFRLILSKLTSCKVYDIFDESIYDDLCTFSTEFIYSKLRDENVKIILIASECAQVLYDTFNSLHENSTKDVCVDNCCNVYREFESLDHFIILTLKKIQISVDPKPFQKFFISRLPALSGNNNFLHEIYPHRRFNIPDQIQTLIQCLVGWQDLNEIENNLLPLRNSLNTLTEYIKTNPDYLYNQILRENFQFSK